MLYVSSMSQRHQNMSLCHPLCHYISLCVNILPCMLMCYLYVNSMLICLLPCMSLCHFVSQHVTCVCHYFTLYVSMSPVFVIMSLCMLMYYLFVNMSVTLYVIMSSSMSLHHSVYQHVTLCSTCSVSIGQWQHSYCQR